MVLERHGGHDRALVTFLVRPGQTRRWGHLEVPAEERDRLGRAVVGLQLVPAPGHTLGTQVVVVEAGGRPVVVADDVTVWLGELDEPSTEGQLLVRALTVWLAHEHEPWRPRTAGVVR